MRFIVLRRTFTGFISIFAFLHHHLGFQSVQHIVADAGALCKLSLLLALNIIIRSPIPVQAGLFDVHIEPPSAVVHTPSPAEILTGLGQTLVY